MRRHSLFSAVLLSQFASAGCTPATHTAPDAYSAIPIPDATTTDAAIDARGSDAGMDARTTSDTGACSATNLHSDVGNLVAHGTTTGMVDRRTPSCGGGASGPDVSFTWTAPHGGMYVIDTDGSDFDTVLDVLMGCSGNSLACDDDGGPDGLTSRVMVTVGNGQTIGIVVDGHASGNFVLNIQPYSSELCNDGVDNDGDGDTDCIDFDCIDAPNCVETNCTNGLDDDGDGDTDCIDFDCIDAPNCIETNCTNGLDDDGDGDIDCVDFDCIDAPNCIETVCDDGLDNDHDLYVDCADADCSTFAACDESIHCADHRDNDGDGDVDCADGDCAAAANCTTPETNCNDGLDDDGDSLIDCSDADCDAVCAESDVASCMNGSDDDGDALIDCADRQCSCSTACPPAVTPSTTCPDQALGSAVGNGVYRGHVTPYACGARSDSTCGNGGLGAEIELSWTAPAAGTYVFDTEDVNAAGGIYDTILTIRDNCTIDGNEIVCSDDDGTGRLSRATATLTAGQAVVVVIDAYGVWDGGNVTLNIHAM